MKPPSQRQILGECVLLEICNMLIIVQLRKLWKKKKVKGRIFKTSLFSLKPMADLLLILQILEIHFPIIYLIFLFTDE